MAPAPAPVASLEAGQTDRYPLPTRAIMGLAVLALPRVLAHDLRLGAPGTLAATLLALLPLLVWVVVGAVAFHRPLPSLVAAGAGYGTVLAMARNMTWGAAWADAPPRLEGNLAGLWLPATEELLLRGAAAVSSLATGVGVGLAVGLLAWAVQQVCRRFGLRLPRP